MTQSKQPKKPKPAPPGRNQNRPSGAIFMPVRIFDNAPVNIEIGQKRPDTLSERRKNALTPTPREKRRQQPRRGQRNGKEQRQPLTRARALIPGAIENSIKQYHIQPPPAEQKRAPKNPAGHPKQENTKAERRPPAGDNDRKKRAAARGGKESLPAAYVPGRTADRRRPTAAAGALAPCPDHPAGGSHHRQNSQNRRKSSNQKPKADEMKENLQKLQHSFTY